MERTLSRKLLNRRGFPDVGAGLETETREQGDRAGSGDGCVEFDKRQYEKRRVASGTV